jgi:hypothetical protein
MQTITTLGLDIAKSVFRSQVEERASLEQAASHSKLKPNGRVER